MQQAFDLAHNFFIKLDKDPEVNYVTSKYKIRSKFIPPRSAWHRWFDKGMIGLVKGCLFEVLFEWKISLNDLQTILTEVKSRVNNCPLTHRDDSTEQLEPLTPSYLLYGRMLALHAWIEDDEQYQPQP